jgi:serine/threonine-protein kinase
VGAWVESVAGDSLKERAQRLREAEESTGINAVIDVEGLQKRLADAHLSFPGRESDGRIPISGHRPMPAPTGETATQPLRNSNWVRREGRAAWLLRSAVLVGVLLLIAVIVLLLRPAQTVETSQALPSAQPTPSAAAAAPGPAPTEAPAGPVGVQLSDLPQEAPAASAQPSNGASAGRVTRKPAAKPSHTPANCVPPYVLDSQGRKRFKPECF